MHYYDRVFQKKKRSGEGKGENEAIGNKEIAGIVLYK